ncbi:hypothetical protein [Bacillus paranthracis]|uniref:hypothetical protein n=1 Tax=Bacillus paranthracis TaxID=2026186 RepID=UPI0022E1BAFA|nr:hypothetical protein [Bacillus paranthracis]
MKQISIESQVPVGGKHKIGPTEIYPEIEFGTAKVTDVCDWEDVPEDAKEELDGIFEFFQEEGLGVVWVGFKYTNGTKLPYSYMPAHEFLDVTTKL